MDTEEMDTEGGLATLDNPNGIEPPDDDSTVAEDMGDDDDFELDPDNDQDQIVKIISGLDDDMLDVLAAACYAAAEDPDAEIAGEDEDEADNILASMSDRQAAVLPHAGHPFVQQAVEHEMAYRQGGDNAGDKLARTVGGMTTDPEKIDLLHAICQVAAGNPDFESDPDASETAEVERIMDKMTHSQLAVLRSAAAGNASIRAMARTCEAGEWGHA